MEQAEQEEGGSEAGEGAGMRTKRKEVALGWAGGHFSEADSRLVY